MKWFPLIFFVVLTSNAIQAQRLVIKNNNRYIRAGFQNALGFSIDKKFDSIDLRVTQGSAERQGNTILLWPAIHGKDTLIATVYYKRSMLLIDTIAFDIIKPEIFPSFGGDRISGKKVTSAHLIAIGGIIFYIQITDGHWEGSGVESYRFSVIRKGSCIYSKIETSNKFSDEIKSYIKQLLPGDIILISEARINPKYDIIANILPGVFQID